MNENEGKRKEKNKVGKIITRRTTERKRKNSEVKQNEILENKRKNNERNKKIKRKKCKTVETGKNLKKRKGKSNKYHIKRMKEN